MWRWFDTPLDVESTERREGMLAFCVIPGLKVRSVNPIGSQTGEVGTYESYLSGGGESL